MGSKSESPFEAFPPGAIRFLAALAKNNQREWFQPRKQEFDELVHAPLVQFAEAVNAMLLKEAPQYAYPQPAKALNRIYRDIRFSKDKTPYQNHVSILFPHQRLGKKVGAALYFGLSATEVTIAGGMYFGETSELQAVREHLSEKHNDFRSILRSRGLKDAFGELRGETLKKPPKQFGEDHPAAPLLQQKQWLLLENWPAKRAAEPGFAKDAIKSFKLLIPFVSFLNAPLEQLQKKSL